MQSGRTCWKGLKRGKWLIDLLDLRSRARTESWDAVERMCQSYLSTRWLRTASAKSYSSLAKPFMFTSSEQHLARPNPFSFPPQLWNKDTCSHCSCNVATHFNYRFTSAMWVRRTTKACFWVTFSRVMKLDRLLENRRKSNRAWIQTSWPIYIVPEHVKEI